MKSNQLVSVIIPVYNREQLVVEAINSVYNQTYRPIECVVIDDGSTDNSLKTVQELKQTLDSDNFTILSIKQANAGAPAARNNGIKNATGDFFQFLDSDDFLYPNKIDEQIAVLKSNPDMAGVYGDWHHGTIEKHTLIKGEQWKDPIRQFYGGRVIHTLSFLFRRSMINKIGPWDIKLKRNQEVDYFLRAALAGGKFAYLPKITGLWREHSGERIVSSNGALSALAFHDKWLVEFSRLGLLSDERKKTVANFFFWHAMELKMHYQKEALHYLNKALVLNPNLPEFNTPKLKLLRSVFGQKLSIKWWYHRAKLKSRNKSLSYK